MGRHALSDGKRKSKTIGVSVTPAEHDRYHAAAKARGMRLADMIREAIEAFLKTKSHRP